MEISMSGMRSILSILFLGAASLFSMEHTKSFDKIKDGIFNSHFSLTAGRTDKNLQEARKLLGLPLEGALALADIESAYTKRLDRCGKGSCGTIVEQAYNLLRGSWISEKVAIIMQSKVRTDEVNHCIKQLPDDNFVKRFFLSDDKRAFFEQEFEKEELDSMRKEIASGYVGIDYFEERPTQLVNKNSYHAFPQDWCAVIFDARLSQALLAKISALYQQANNNSSRMHVKQTTQWIFSPWWVPSDMKKKYQKAVVGLPYEQYPKAFSPAPYIPSAISMEKEPPSQIQRVVIETVDNPKEHEGLFTRIWHFAWKKPVVTCSIVGATLLGGYYAVKNNLFSNWLGRVRSSFGSALGSTLLRR